MNDPAFPNPKLSEAHYGNCEGYTGITIRDYFAAELAPALVAAVTAESVDASGFPANTGWIAAEAAQRAYVFADAMLEARAYVPPTASPKPDLAAGLEQYKRDTALHA